MRTKFVDACLKVESRYTTGGIDGTVQNNRTIGVIQGDFFCKLIVYKWKGEIWIDPDYTGGARFVFSHPLNIEKE